MGLDEDDPTLKDIMLALGNIKSRLTTHDARLDEMPCPSNRGQGRPGLFSKMAQPGAKACEAFNKGQ